MANSNFNQMMQSVAKSQLNRPHVTVHCYIDNERTKLTLAGLRTNEDGDRVNADVILVDDEPNTEGYYLFWSLEQDEEGELIHPTPGIFSKKQRGRCKASIAPGVLTDLQQKQEEFQEQREAARAKRDAEASDKRPEGSADYDDYANELPAQEESPI